MPPTENAPSKFQSKIVQARLTQNLHIPPGRAIALAASEASLKCSFAGPGASLLGLKVVSFEEVSSSERDFAMG